MDVGAHWTPEGVRFGESGRQLVRRGDRPTKIASYSIPLSTRKTSEAGTLDAGCARAGTLR
jgi:hypothetical protein